MTLKLDLLDQLSKNKLMASFTIIELHSVNKENGGPGITQNLVMNRQFLYNKFFDNDGHFTQMGITPNTSQENLKRAVLAFIKVKSDMFGLKLLEDYNKIIDLYKLIIDLLIQKYILFNDIDSNILKTIIKQFASIFNNVQRALRNLDTNLKSLDSGTPYFSTDPGANENDMYLPMVEILCNLLNRRHEVSRYVSIVEFFNSMNRTLNMEFLLKNPEIFTNLSSDTSKLSIFCQTLFYNIVFNGINHTYNNRYIVVPDARYIDSIDIDLIVYPTLSDLETSINNLGPIVTGVIREIEQLILAGYTDIDKFLVIFTDLLESITTIEKKILENSKSNQDVTSRLKTELDTKDNEILSMRSSMESTDAERVTERDAQNREIAKKAALIERQLEEIDTITKQLRTSMANEKVANQTLSTLMGSFVDDDRELTQMVAESFEPADRRLRLNVPSNTADGLRLNREKFNNIELDFIYYKYINIY